MAPTVRCAGASSRGALSSRPARFVREGAAGLGLLRDRRRPSTATCGPGQPDPGRRRSFTPEHHLLPCDPTWRQKRCARPRATLRISALVEGRIWRVVDRGGGRRREAEGPRCTRISQAGWRSIWRATAVAAWPPGKRACPSSTLRADGRQRRSRALPALVQGAVDSLDAAGNPRVALLVAARLRPDAVGTGRATASNSLAPTAKAAHRALCGACPPWRRRYSAAFGRPRPGCPAGCLAGGCFGHGLGDEVLEAVFRRPLLVQRRSPAPWGHRCATPFKEHHQAPSGGASRCHRPRSPRSRNAPCSRRTFRSCRCRRTCHSVSSIKAL